MFSLKAMKLSAAAYSAFVATSATKAGRYGGIRRVGEYIISHQNLQSKSLQPIYLISYVNRDMYESILNGTDKVR